MPTLYRTACSTDWKGRPHHELKVLAIGTKDELLAIQDADVARWQAEDVSTDKLQELEDAAEEERDPNPIPDTWEREEERDPNPIPDTWEREGERWEMQRTDGPRSFAEQFDDGGEWSLVYHILD